MDSIFFFASKVVHILIEPLNGVLILVFFALLFLLLRKQQLARRMLSIALCLGLFVGYLPSSQWGMRALEEAVPQTPLTPAVLAEVGGVIILGGAIEGGLIAQDRGEVSIFSAAERVTKAMELLRQNPELPFIFSGYSGRLMPQGPSEADAFKQLLQEQGLGAHPGYYENQSRNTYENFLYTKQIIDAIDKNTVKDANLVKGEKDSTAPKPWLLITSARHMLRSLQVANKLDIAVIPVLVDYQTSKQQSWHRFDLVEGGEQWNWLIHECIGIAAYWLTGKLEFR